jgi:hypothetical protein
MNRGGYSLKAQCLDGNYLDCRGNFIDIVTNIFFTGPFEWDFGTDNTHEYANLVNILFDFVESPTIGDRGSIR